MKRFAYAALLLLATLPSADSGARVSAGKRMTGVWNSPSVRRMRRIENAAWSTPVPTPIRRSAPLLPTVVLLPPMGSAAMPTRPIAMTSTPISAIAPTVPTAPVSTIAPVAPSGLAATVGRPLNAPTLMPQPILSGAVPLAGPQAPDASGLAVDPATGAVVPNGDVVYPGPALIAPSIPVPTLPAPTAPGWTGLPVQAPTLGVPMGFHQPGFGPVDLPRPVMGAGPAAWAPPIGTPYGAWGFR